VVGAGASVAAGFPQTSDLLQPVLDALPQRKHILTSTVNCVTDLHMASAILDALRTRFNASDIDFELVIASLEELMSSSVGRGPVIAAFTSANPELAQLFDGGLLAYAHTSAIEAVLEAVRSCSPTSVEQQASAQSLIRLLTCVAQRARVVVVSLNYDTVLDNALTSVDGFIRTARTCYSRFNPENWIATVESRSQNLFMHLHGSLRFGFSPITELAPGVPFDEAVKYNVVEDAAESTRGRVMSHVSVDGQFLIASPIIAGRHKGAKMLYNVRPYAYYNATALQEIATADRLLVIGYGWRDDHINAWIDEHIRSHAAARVVIVTKRTGKDLFGNTAQERRLLRLAPTDRRRDSIYEPVAGGSEPLATHGEMGHAYLVATGLPLDPEAQAAVLSQLLD